MIFEYLPIAIWEEDLSILAKLRKNLESRSVMNFRNYLTTNPELVKKTFRQIKIIDINKAAVKLYGAKSKEALISNLGKNFSPDLLNILIDEFASLLEGKSSFESEFKMRATDGTTHDVLIKVAVPDLYKDSFYRVIVTLQDITDRKKLERNLRQRAQIDGLTKLLNHNSIAQRLEQEVLRAKRYRLTLSCFMIDLDNFKSVNDQFGHQKGDQVLKRVATLIKNSLRKVDIVGRYGGDEFLVILPETNPENAKIAAKRIQDLFYSKPFKFQKGAPITITLSTGISGYPRHEVEHGKDLIALADKAMYKAKKMERDRIVIF